MTARAPSRLLPAALVLIALPAVAGAQIMEAPRRPTGNLLGRPQPPPDPNRTTTELTLSLSAVGGYDDNLAQAAPTGGSIPEGESGTLSQGSAGLQFYRGRPARSFSFDGSGYAARYGSSSVGVVSGGGIGAAAQTQARRHDMFSVSTHLNYDPLYTLGRNSPLDPVIVDAPVAEVALGLFEQASWSTATEASYSWEMSRRNQAVFSYGFDSRTYGNAPSTDSGAIGDTYSHRAGADYLRGVSRNTSLRSHYDYWHTEAQDTDGNRPLTQHSIDGGFVWDKRLPRQRALQVALSAGAQYATTLTAQGGRRESVDYWTPFGEGQARLDFGRTWNVSADYRRGTTVIPELTTESYVTDAVSAQTSGNLGSRVRLNLNVAYDAGGAATETDSDATYRNFTAGADLLIPVTSWLAASVTYAYYDYQFENTDDLPTGFSPNASRNTVRVGLSVWIPLVSGQRTSARP